MRRVRWGNVGLVAAVCTTLVFGLAWAFSASPGPALPADVARPLVREAAVPAIESQVAERPAARTDREDDARPKARARKHPPPAKPKRRRPKVERPRATPTPTPTPAATAPRVAPPVRRVATTTPPASTGGGEFGFEGG